MAVRALRGATRLERDDGEEMCEAVAELLTAMLERNALTSDDLISAIFTATPDLHAQFPALAARQLGMGEVPLLCAQELGIEGAMTRVVRVLAHAETDVPRAEVRHVYLRGTEALRRDLAQ